MSAELRIKQDALNDLSAAVDAIGSAAESFDFRLVMGAAMRETIRNHFFEIAQDSAHHRTAAALGASPTGVYEEAARGTEEPEIESEGVSVSVHQVAIAQRFFGGPIEPVNAKFLAIPARTESYGRRPREFDNLRAIIFSSGAGALVARDATAVRGGLSRGGEKGVGRRYTAGVGQFRKGQEMGGQVFFWLVKQVTQAPDPTVLPADEEIIDSAVARATSYLTRVWSERSVA